MILITIIIFILESIFFCLIFLMLWYFFPKGMPRKFWKRLDIPIITTKKNIALKYIEGKMPEYSFTQRLINERISFLEMNLRDWQNNDSPLYARLKADQINSINDELSDLKKTYRLTEIND